MSVKKQIQGDVKAEMSQLIKFIPEDNSLGTDKCRRHFSGTTLGALSGKEVKDFYEKITTKEGSAFEEDEGFRASDSKQIKNTAHKKQRLSLGTDRSKLSSDRKAMKFLKYAEQGDLESLKQIYKSDVNIINVTDSFGWSALMCGAHSGHVNIVKYLMKCGIDSSLTDQKGRTAEKLARIAGHKQVVSALSLSDKRNETVLSTAEKTEVSTPFFCEVCRREFSDTDRTKHLSSTVHLFNSRLKPKPGFIGLPSNNIGFRMMLRSGWEASTGLGPEGKGQRYPIKTVLKRDRKGLGNKMKAKAKVTHFEPHDETAVKSKRKFVPSRTPSVKAMSRRLKRAKEKREKEWEKNMRIYMNMD